MCGTKSSHLSHPIDSNPIPEKSQIFSLHTRIVRYYVRTTILWCKKRQLSNREESKGKYFHTRLSVLVSCSMFDFPFPFYTRLGVRKMRGGWGREWATHSFIRYNNVVVRYSKNLSIHFPPLHCQCWCCCCTYLRKYVNIWLVPLNSTFAFCLPSSPSALRSCLHVPH